MYQKIRPKRVSDEIYDQLKALIFNGQLKPGYKLPSERELALKMQISRPPLREAVMKLEAQGFLEQIQGDGTYVKSMTSQKMDRVFEELAKRENTIFDIMEIRTILEIWAAETAARKADEKSFEEIEKYLKEMEEAKNKEKIGFVSDASFHAAISKATNNVLLIHMINNLYQWIEKISYDVRMRKYQNPQAHLELYDQHREIFYSIKQRKSEQAAKAMRRHMEYVMEDLKNSMLNPDETNKK